MPRHTLRLLLVVVLVQVGVDHSGPTARARAEAVAPDANSWTTVVRAAMPAVGHVASSRTIRGRGPVSADPFFRFFFDAPGPTRRERSLGSGVLVSRSGLVLTNNHVVEGAQEIRVALGDRREFKARLIGTDPKTDLAVLRIPGDGFPVVPLGNSDRVEVAEPVVAIGNPFGLGQTVTMGIVSAVGRANLGIADYEDFIQTDTAINPGNSGGALINQRGELVGINTAIFSQSGGYQGIGFAVPANMARAVMEQIVSRGRVVRGSLGVLVQDTTPALARGLGLVELRGVVVSDIAPSGPAGRADLRRGDVILRVGDRATDDSGHFRNLVAQLTPGATARLTVRRDGREHVIDVPVVEQTERTVPTATVDRPAPPDPVGLSVGELTADVARRLGIPRDVQGAVVTDVMRGGLAEEAGLRAGDVIQEVNRRAVRTPRDVARLFADARGNVVLLVNRSGSTGFLVIERGG